MYYKIEINKSYVSNLDNGAKVLNITTPTEDIVSSATLYRTLSSSAASGSVEAGVYTPSSVSITKQVSNPNYIALELTISGLTFSSLSALKENLRLRFVDAKVALSFVYSQVYSSDKELVLATNYRVVGVGLKNINGLLESATVNVKLDIYSPDQYATLNRHSEVFTGRQFGEIMTTALERFEFLKEAYNDKDTILRTHNLFYAYDENINDGDCEYEKIDGSDVTSDDNKIVTTTYKVTKSVRKTIVPHIIPYSVQYNESTYDYLRRLCRRFGETLYFEDGMLHVGIQPSNVGSVSLASAYSNIAFNELTDSQSTLYVGGNYMTDSTNSFPQGKITDDTVLNIENQEVGTDEDYVDLLSNIDTAWAEDNPGLDDYYLDYLGETDAHKEDISQEERYSLVDNSIVYWPAIAVRLISQILSFKVTEMEKYGEFIFDNVLSIYESYRLVGEGNKGYLKYIEAEEYSPRPRYGVDTTSIYMEEWTKSTSNGDEKNKGVLKRRIIDDNDTDLESEILKTESSGVELNEDGSPKESEARKMKAGIRYVDSPRGLAEIMYRSNFALTSFISKTSAESGRNSLKVTLKTSDDADAGLMSVISSMRLGSVVTLDDVSTDGVEGQRYVVCGIKVYNVSNTTATVNVPEQQSNSGGDGEFMQETGSNSEVVNVDYSVELTPVVELELIPCVTTSYAKIIGASKTTTDVTLEVAIPHFKPDDMIRRAEPQRAFVVDVKDSRKLNRARVCYPWQYGSKAGSSDMSLDAITALSRDTTLPGNLSKGASPWLRVSTPVNNGGNSGFIASPALYSEVMVSYESGNIERPYISGSLFSGPKSVLLGHQLADNSIFSTQHGRKILLSDVAVGGSNSVLTSIFPFTSMLGLDTTGAVAEKMDGYIQIGDIYGLCSINLSSTKRAVSISSPMGSVNISALTGINVIAPSGDVTISGKNVNIMAENNLNIVSGARVGRMRRFSAEFSGKSIKHKILSAMTGGVKGVVDSGLGEIIDLSLVRTLLECFIVPVGGTMVIKSHRYLCIEGGVGRTNMPESTNNKCYISEVLKGYIRLFDPLSGWRAVRYQKCYDVLRKELIGSGEGDKDSLIFKCYGSGDDLTDSGKELRQYVERRIVAPDSFPNVNYGTFEFFDDATAGGEGYGKWLKKPVAEGDIPDVENETAAVRAVRVARLRAGYEKAPASPEVSALKYKLMMMRHAFNDYKQFVNEDVPFYAKKSNSGGSFMQKRLDDIPEKRNEDAGIKSIINNMLFDNNIAPTYATIKAEGVGGYPLIKQALFGSPSEKMASKRILLLMLLIQITEDVIKKYDVDEAQSITEDILFAGFNEMVFDAVWHYGRTIKKVFSDYIDRENANDAISIKGKRALDDAEIEIINRDWAKLCNNFNLETTRMYKSSVAASKAKSVGEFTLKAIGLDPVGARDSIIPWNRVKTDRRTSDMGAILISTSPNATMKFNSNTATFDKVGTTENAVVAAFKAALLSV